MMKKILSTSLFLIVFLGIWAGVINQAHAASTTVPSVHVSPVSTSDNPIVLGAPITITVNDFTAAIKQASITRTLYGKPYQGLWTFTST